jgi:hypothetical protein
MSAQPVDPWIGLKGTLTDNENNPGIDAAKADLIIALLQMAEQQNPGFTARRNEIVDALKLKSIEDLHQLDAALIAIAGSIGAPTISISITEQNVKWWRTFTTCLFGAGVAIAVINVFVPIEFGLIATTVFATGIDAARVFFSAFSGTSGPAEAAAAAAAATEAAAAGAGAGAGAGASMVAGPDLSAVGSLLYTTAAAALITCKGAVVSLASTAASAVCSLMSLANAEKVADLAVQATTIAVITTGLDKGLDWVVKFYRGDFDAAMALAIDQGIFNAFEYTVSATVMESADNIVAANDKLAIKMSDAPAWSKLFIPPNRFLDVNIIDIIKGRLDAFLTILSKTKRLGSYGDIINELSVLDNPVLVQAAITRLKPKYGMGIIILYMLLSQKSKKARSGYGLHESGTSSQPTEPAEKWVEMPAKSDSMFASVGRPGLNPYIVDYNLKTKILHDAGYKDYIPFVYIPDFQGTMSDCMKQVLGCLYKEARPGLGNIFTRISKIRLNDVRQKHIFDYMLERCTRPILPPVENELVYEESIQATATEVRNMMALQPSAESLMDLGPAEASSLMDLGPAAAGPFANIAKTESAFLVIPPYTSKATGKAPGSTGKAPGSTGKAPLAGQENIYTIKGKGTGSEVEAFTDTRKKPKGGRKSRRYKKRKATLKRRRIRRRSTRKGRKRRYTKRR